MPEREALEKVIHTIKQEFSVSESNRRPYQFSRWTMKDYVSAIHKSLQDDEAARRWKHHDEKYESNWNLSAVGIIGLAFVFGLGRGSTDIEWIDQNAFGFLCTGLIACTWFVLMSLERASLFAALSKFTSVRVTAGFLFAAGVAVATSDASSSLNAVLGVDASNAPLARAFLVAALFLKLLWPVFVILALLAAVNLLVIFSYFKWMVSRDERSPEYRVFPVAALIFLVASLVLSAVYMGTMRSAFSDKNIPEKAYRLALQLDFNEAAYCLPPIKGHRYLFIGANQNKVLIAPVPMGELTLTSFATTSPSRIDDAPHAVKVVNCNPLP